MLRCHACSVLLLVGLVACCPDNRDERVAMDGAGVVAAVNTQLADFRQGLDAEHHLRWTAEEALLAPDASAMKVFLQHQRDPALRRAVVLAWDAERQAFTGRLAADRRIDLPDPPPGQSPPAARIVVPLERL